MQIDGFEVEQFNNQESVLVSKYSFKGEIIYFFKNLEDEIYCVKDEEGYKQITESFKSYLLKNVFDSSSLKKNRVLKKPSKFREDIAQTLRNAGVNAKFLLVRHKYSPEIVQRIVNEQKDNFRRIKERFGLDIDIDRCDEVLDELKFYKRPAKTDAIGVYRPPFKSVEYEEQVIDNWDDNNSKEVRLHECIHAQMGLNPFILAAIGLIEGQTENLASAYIGENHSSFRTLNLKNEHINIVNNFSENTTYPGCVAIIRQMEVALGKKSYESIINGKGEFEKEFIKKYGIRAFCYLAGKTDQMRGYLRNPKTGYMLKDTQDKLLQIVFDKDFKDISSVEDAKSYFEKLRQFDLQRSRIDIWNREKGLVYSGKEFYQKYYEQKYEQVKEKLETLGVSKEEIASSLYEYSYEPQQFYPEEENLDFEHAKLAELVYAQTKQGQEYDLSNYKMFRTLTKDGKVGHFIVFRDKVYDTRMANNEQTGEYGPSITFEIELEKAFEFYKSRGVEIEDITDSIDEEVFLSKIEDIRETKRVAEEWKKEINEKQEDLTQKENIFSKIIKRIRETFNNLRRKTALGLPTATNEKEEPKKERPKEDKLPSWDMRNYSQEEQNRAHIIDGPLPEQEKVDANPQKEAENDEIEQ